MELLIYTVKAVCSNSGFMFAIGCMQYKKYTNNILVGTHIMSNMEDVLDVQLILRYIMMVYLFLVNRLNVEFYEYEFAETNIVKLSLTNFWMPINILCTYKSLPIGTY